MGSATECLSFPCSVVLPPPYRSSRRCGGFASVLPSSALFLSDARSCWSTFIYRTTGLRAVEDFVVEVLLTLVGHTLMLFAPLGLCFPSLIFCLDYNTPFGGCQALFLFFFIFFLACGTRTRTTEPTDRPQPREARKMKRKRIRTSRVSCRGRFPRSLRLHPFCAFIIARLTKLVKYFFYFFVSFCSQALTGSEAHSEVGAEPVQVLVQVGIKIPIPRVLRPFPSAAGVLDFFPSFALPLHLADFLLVLANRPLGQIALAPLYGVPTHILFKVSSFPLCVLILPYCRQIVKDFFFILPRVFNPRRRPPPRGQP